MNENKEDTKTDSQQNSSIICQDTLTKLREELKEHFTCFICLDLATNPVVIPCCGQIVCSKCLQNWVSSNSGSACPYCRQEMTTKNGIPIKWADNIKKFLRISVQDCPKHHKTLEFYCKTCNCFLCPDCLFEELKQKSTKHRSHSIMKFSEMLKVLKTQIQSELLKVLPKMTVVENNLLEIQERNKELYLAKESVLIDMNKKFAEIKKMTEEEFNDYESLIDKALENLLRVRQKIKEEINTIQEQVNGKLPVSTKFYKRQIQKFDEIKRGIPNYEVLNHAPEFNDLIVQFNNFPVYIPKFKEKNEQFKNLPDDAIHFYYPLKVNINGNTWRVKIYPNGNLNGEGTHLSVFLELLRGPKTPSTYSYKIVIQNLTDPRANIQREYSSQFAETDSWGWNKAALLETLFDGNYLDKDGGLHIYFSIKPESYYQIYLDYDRAIKRKKEKCEKLKKILKEFESNQFTNVNDNINDSDDLFKNDNAIKSE